jgi:hypothetical protein
MKIVEIEKMSFFVPKTVQNWKKNREHLYNLLKNINKEEVVSIINRTREDDKKLTVKDVFGE